jgi:protease IV
MSFSLWDFIKNALLILFALQLFPILIDGIRKQYSTYLDNKTSVGVIRINKVIYDAIPYIRQFRSLAKNNSIKAIVLRIDCQGSASGTAQALFNEIMDLKKEYQKPVIAYIENIAASGGYWVASAADHIISQGTALIGSIGATFTPFFYVQQFLDQHKISSTTLKAGSYKTVGNPFDALTPQEIAMLQMVLDDSYEQFVQTIAQMRHLSLDTIGDWADGKIFTGRQALALGLIDELGSVHALIKSLKDRTLIEGDIEWVHVQQPKSVWRSLFSMEEDDDSSGTFLSSALHQVCTFVEQHCLKVRLC